MSTIKQLQGGNWQSKTFWKSVDELTWSQKEVIVRSVGGSRAVRTKHLYKTKNARGKGLSVGLSCMDYAVLLFIAGITALDVSQTGYHLARHLDKGNYDRRNCRFITQAENRAEEKTSETLRESSRRVVVLANDRLLKLRTSDPDRYWDIKHSNLRKAHAATRRMKVEDPTRYESIQKRRQVAAGKAITAARKLRDERVWKTRFSRRVLIDIGYPAVGWQTKTANCLGMPRPTLQNFLKRNPSFLKSKLLTSTS